MGYNIPPAGFCVTCLAARRNRVPALVLFRGTGLCEEHLELVLADEPEEGKT
jgi:hypothetical protein